MENTLPKPPRPSQLPADHVAARNIVSDYLQDRNDALHRLMDSMLETLQLVAEKTGIDRKYNERVSTIMSVLTPLTGIS